MSSESDTRTTSTSATAQSGTPTPTSNDSYSSTFTASESSSRKKIKGWSLKTDQKDWSDSIHQQCKPKFPEFKAGKHPYLKQGLKYWGHSPRDAWSRGIVDYDPCDTLECGCAPTYEDDGPCVVNNNCPNCPKVPRRPVRKKQSCPQDFRPPRPVISKPFTPVATVTLVKSIPSRPLPKPVTSRPLPKPVVSRPILVPVTSKPTSPWPAATVKFVTSNPSRPITKPSPSRPIPKPVISRPKSAPSRPLPKPVVSKPPPKPVVSRPSPKPVITRPKPVVSRPNPVISRSKPLPKPQPSKPKPATPPPPKRKSPPPKLKSFPPLEPKPPKSILRTPSSTSPSTPSSASPKKHTKKKKKSSPSKDSSSPNYSSSPNDSSSPNYSSSSSALYTDSSSYNSSFVEYHYYEYSTDTDDSKPQKKTEPKPLKQSPSDALRMAILLRRQNAQRPQIPEPEHPILTNPDEGVSVLYTSPGVVPRNFNQRGSDDEGHGLFGDDTGNVPTGRSTSIPAPPEDPNVAPRLMGSAEFRSRMPFTADTTMTTDPQMPSSQRVTFENDQEKQLDYSNDYRNQ